MNLLLIGNHLQIKSSNTNIWQDLAERLRVSGHQVMTTSKRQNKALRLADMLTTIYTKKKQYDLAQIDVFSGPAFTWAYMSGMLLKLINKPFILTLHGGNLPEFSKKQSAKIRNLFSQAAAITVPSNYLLTKMQPYHSNFIFLPNALELASYSFIERFSPRPKLIWLRAFHETYNPAMAVGVVRHMKRVFPDTTLIMVGPDKGDGSLEKTQIMAKQLDLQVSISFPGGITKYEVPNWLNKGDIFLNTTNYDNTPISVMEAMACGLCIVSTNVGGIPHLLEDGVDALLVPPNDPEAMAAAVRRILEESGLAVKLSRNARMKAEQFDWSVILPKWQKLFIEVMEKQGI